MKKFLSIILVAALLVSIVPSVFAAVDTATGLNTQTYKFNCTELGLAKTAFNSAELPGKATTADATGDAWQILSWTTPYNVSGGTSYIDGSILRYIAPKKPAGEGSVLIAFNVDAPGKYKPTLLYQTQDRGPYIKTYFLNSVSEIIRDTTGANDDLYENIISTDKLLSTEKGEKFIDSYSDAGAQATCDFETVTFNAPGTYYVAFVADGANSAVTKNPIIVLEGLTLTQTEPYNPEAPTDNGKIVYGFNAESTGNGSDSGTGVTILKGEYTKSINGGFWQYVATNFKNANIYGSFIKCTAKDGHIASPETPVYLTLEINVDKAGTYTPSIECENRSRGGHLKIYLVEEESYTGFENVYSSKTPLDNKYIETYTSDTASYKVHSFKNVTLNAGTYYLIFAVDGINSAATDTAQEHIKNFTLTPVEDAPSGNITYCVASNLSDKLQIKTTARGNKINLSAEEKEGYTFRAWVRGSADNGTWVSADPDYSFTAMTNTMLTAIYTENPAEDEKVVEYYNENGEYLATKDIEEEAPTPTKLVGYEFDDWYVGDGIKLALDSITDALTRAVAKHNVEDQEYTISYNENENYKYDEEVTLTSSEAVCWLRDGKPVDYGTTYTFYVWDDTTVTTKSGDNSPKVMLDTPKGNSWMIEYDEGNGDIVEAGIIFGDSSAITIDSCSEKMISQRLSDHGQFTATSECSAARGYIIYKNVNGGLEIIYAD